MKLLKSFCKVNLSIRVLKKLKNGLHNIQTNSFLLNLHDDIKINRIYEKKDNIIFFGEFKNLVSKYKNSVSSTLNILRKLGIIRKGYYYKILIKKKIPVFSGLGGGTSNSFFIIKHFIKKKINNNILSIFEKKVGTDLKLFLFKKNYQKNIKEFKSFNRNFTFYFVLIYPQVKCSTKYIYSKVKNFSKPSKVDLSKITSKKRFIEMIKLEKNDLETIVVSKFNILKKVLYFISIQKGCYFSRMTGSGSACFGMFKSKELALLGLRKIKKRFPKYWCVYAKTI